MNIKTLCILIATALLAAGNVRAGDPKDEGYAAGKETGEEQAALGLNMPTDYALQKFAETKFKFGGHGAQTPWTGAFGRGFVDGFEGAKKSFRPATANAERYDQPSYWAGYKAGYAPINIDGDERDRMFRRIDADIAKNHYDKESHNNGFLAGTADADKQEAQTKEKQAAQDRKTFEKKSYEAGYAAEKEMHKLNGIQPSIEAAIAFDEKTKQWDQESWSAGYRAAHEEDTRP